MKFNLKCNTNCHDHIDYRLPIAPEKADLRTNYNISHEYFHPIPQDFDCRVKTKPNKDLLQTDIRIKEELIPVYKKDYVFKQKQEDLLVKYGRSHHINDVHYARNLQERLNKGPPPSVPNRVSEMKFSYGIPAWSPSTREVMAPAIAARCDVSGLARPLQPSIPPEKDGFWKYLDNYMTQNRLDFRPFTETEFINARKDLPTRYNTTGKYPKSKYVLGDALTGNKEIYDKQVMSTQYPNKNLSRGWKRIPHRGMQSEYDGSYTPHTFSDIYPYLYDNGVIFPCASSNECSPWQTFAPPAMYCTEYCHMGTGYPIRSILNCLKQENIKYPHKAMEPFECFE